jgi:chorismate synthase
MKYGIADNSGIGRASARQTVCRVVGGAIAKIYLKKFGIEIHAWDCRDAVCHVSTYDTFGALVHCVIKNLPAGLGEPMYDKFDARLAYAMLSINACKGFEIGKGFAAANMKGSEYNDIQNPDFSFQSNKDGGVQAGITNGQEVYFSLAFKPIPTLQMEQNTSDFEGNPVIYTGNNRNDRCVVPRVLPIVEAMAALVTADFLIQYK